MIHLIEHYPTALKVFTFVLILVNLLCWGEAEALMSAALIQCCAHTATFLQALLQRLLLPFILITSALPMLLCSVGQLIAALLLWTGDLRTAALLAVLPILSFLLHLMVLAVGCALIGLAEGD